MERSQVGGGSGSTDRVGGVLVAIAAALAIVACGGSEGGFTLGAEAQIDISPNVITFGDVPRGEVARRNITVRHIGTSGTIRLDPIMIESSSPDLEIGLIEAVELEPGQVSRIQVVYTSANDPPDEGVLVIGHNIANNPDTRIPISTPGQRAFLIPSPGVLDFAVVQAGAPRTLELKVLNGGTAPATLTGFEIEGDKDDFQVALTPGTVVPADGSAVLNVTYAPTGRDSDTAVLTLLTDREDVSMDVTMYGEEETPVLVVEPALFQLGWVEPGEGRTASVSGVIRNDGNIALNVQGVALQGGPVTLDIRLGVGSGWPLNQPFSLEPNETMPIHAVFAPNEEHPMTADPLARIRIDSNDEARNPLHVPVFGAAGTPSLVVIPEDIVDFAYVAQGFVATRSVVVLNQGNSAVTLTGASLVDPTTTEFSFVDADRVPVVINPGESVELELNFENRGAAVGDEFAKFILTSSDPLVPEYALNVVARRAQRPTCEAAFVPDFLAFGAYRPGETGVASMKVVNFGSGNCEFMEHDMLPCLQIDNVMGFQFECNDNLAFNPFEIRSAPAPETVIGPGETLEVEIAFTAPDLRDTLGIGRDSYYGRIAMLLWDPNSSTLEFVAPPGGWGRGVNLRAEAAAPLIEVDPPAIDFGLVRTDCRSEIRQVSVTATGPLGATIDTLELVGCSDQISIEQSAPLTVPGFGATYINVHYAPDAVEDRACKLRIHNDSLNHPIAEVDLFGRGTDADHVIDVFKQVPPPKIDVLFVVDDSYSMGDDQLRLKQQLPAVVDIATQYAQDYHLAVTTTDTIKIQGQFQGPPLFVSTGMDTAQFAANLVVGTQGHHIERGLEGAYLALFKRNQRTDIACIDVPNACPSDDGDGVPLVCTDGLCSGKNYGFLRDDAELVIIIVSDEEDGSTRPTHWYINKFASLKAPNSGVGVKVHSFIVTSEGCIGGFGTPGHRYAEVSRAFDGHVANICADDFAEQFVNVGARTFGLSDRFYPSWPPDVSTLSVKVDGAPCTSGWRWNPSTHAVIFDEDSSCFPDFDQEIALEYDVFCAAPAP